MQDTNLPLHLEDQSELWEQILVLPERIIVWLHHTHTHNIDMYMHVWWTHTHTHHWIIYMYMSMEDRASSCDDPLPNRHGHCSVLPSISKACQLNKPSSVQNSLWCGEWGQPKSFEVATGSIHTTVNREYFDVTIFSDSMACAKIKRTKYMRNINDNAVQGHLSENYLTRKIIAWNILDTKYSRFTVHVCLPIRPWILLAENTALAHTNRSIHCTS